MLGCAHEKLAKFDAALQAYSAALETFQRAYGQRTPPPQPPAGLDDLLLLLPPDQHHVHPVHHVHHHNEHEGDDDDAGTGTGTGSGTEGRRSRATAERQSSPAHRTAQLDDDGPLCGLPLRAMATIVFHEHKKVSVGHVLQGVVPGVRTVTSSSVPRQDAHARRSHPNPAPYQSQHADTACELCTSDVCDALLAALVCQPHSFRSVCIFATARIVTDSTACCWSNVLALLACRLRPRQPVEALELLQRAFNVQNQNIATGFVGLLEKRSEVCVSQCQTKTQSMFLRVQTKEGLEAGWLRGGRGLSRLTFRARTCAAPGDGGRKVHRPCSALLTDCCE
jgi:hypothetical protein